MILQTSIQRLSWALVLLLMVGRLASAQDVIAISGVVTTRADGLAVPGAVVSVDGADATATTDANGKYTLQVPRAVVHGDRIHVKVDALDALGLPTKVTDVVVNAPTLTVDVSLSFGFAEQVTVGSRAAGADAEKAVPVDVITHDQIAASGYAETAQVI
jgi:hypothetical protein